MDTAISLLDELKGREVTFQSLTESIDTATPTGGAMWQMVGVLAELERSRISERTKAGRAAAMARGVKMGPKFKLSSHPAKHAQELMQQGKLPKEVAQLLNISRSTLYRYIGRSAVKTE